MSEEIALVLGATGGVGGEVARRLAARGWRVRALNRDPERAAQTAHGVEWVKGDAMAAGQGVAARPGSRQPVGVAGRQGHAAGRREQRGRRGGRERQHRAT